MDVVDRGKHHRTVGSGFANTAYLQKWYKKAFMGISKFSLIWAFNACNISFDQLRYIGRGGTIRSNKLMW